MCNKLYYKLSTIKAFCLMFFAQQKIVLNFWLGKRFISLLKVTKNYFHSIKIYCVSHIIAFNNHILILKLLVTFALRQKLEFFSVLK